MASAAALINTPSPGKAALPVAQRGLLTIGVMGAMIMQILDTTIANVALPLMQTSLGATMDSVTWVLTSYIIAAAIAMPVTGWLAERLGSRNLLIFAVSGFIVASMLCGIATSLEEMVAFRMFQGVCGAFVAPLTQTVMLDINPPEKQGNAMSIWGMGIMIGPIMGPMLGGWLAENYNWRWVFYVNLPIGLLTLAILWFLLPSRERTDRKFDGLGFGLLAIALASFQLFLDRGQQEDWFQSWEIIVEFGITLAAVWMAVIHFATAEKPLFDRHLFRNRNFVTCLFLMLLVGITTMAPMALLPPMLQQLFGYPVIDTGLALAPRGFGVLLTMFLAGRLRDKIDMRYVIALGSLICSYSLWQMSHWSLDISQNDFVITGFIQGLGMGLIFMPLNALAFATLDARWRTDGASLLNLLRSIGSSVGISVCTVLLARNMQINHEEIGASITNNTLPYVDLSQAPKYGEFGAAALWAVNAEVTRQSAMIAYLDDFYFMAVVTVVMVPLVFLLKTPTGPVGSVHFGE
jgi:MFS transporter, DHA2 family, multidrug resistance protein